MRICNMSQYILKTVPRIGGIIPKNQLTLLTGLPGSGKSYTLIKFLNSEKITPIYFNLDYDSTIPNELKIFHADPSWIKELLKKEIKDLKDQVVVIDPYINMMLDVFKSGNTLENQNIVVKLLIELCHEESCTIVVVGHSEDFVGKDGIFRDNTLLIRKAYEHIHVEVIMPRGKTVKDILYRTFIKKGRGIGGVKMIENWMRD